MSILDIRVKKTKEHIKQALFIVSHSKGIQHVTIQDIISMAEINRATFYYHYKDKLDLLEKIQEETLEGLVQDLQLCSSESFEEIVYPPILASLYHVQKNADTYQFLLGPDGLSDFNWRMLGIVRFSIRNNLVQLHEQHIDIQIDESILVDFIAGALVSTIVTWIESGLSTSAEYLANQVSSILANGILKKKES